MRHLLILLLCFTCLLGFGQTKTDPNTIAVTDSNNVFAFKLFAAITKSDRNLFFSPFSISSALAMTYAGARNETEKQMSKALNFSLDQPKFHLVFKSLIKGIESDNTDGLQLNIANSLWAQKDYSFSHSFLDIVKSDYNSELQKVDFITQTEQTRKVINAWTEGKTNNKIKDLIPFGALGGGTELVLVNAIYFHGKWVKQFDEKLTRENTFNTVNGTEQTKFMNAEDTFSYSENEYAGIIEIPYKENKVSMLIFLPKQNGIRDLERRFDVSFYNDAIGSLVKQDVVLSLPKFKTTSTYNLNSVLSKMGMPIAFTTAADFSGMTGKPDLQIDKVLHKAFIDVAEDGTEAAAATVVIAIAVNALAKEPEKTVFNADHPFIYIIKDNTTGSILFMGEVQDPQKEE